MPSNHFKQLQVELEHLGYEYVSRNTRGGETWEHPAPHSLVIYPSMKEDAHRSVLRSCKKAVGVKTETNKRNVDQIKDRQAKDRDNRRAENEARIAWLQARIADLEMAATMRALTAKQQQLLDERLREVAELRRLMSQTPTG